MTEPKTWGEMTDAEKGALLLAHHEGRGIESKNAGGNWSLCQPMWIDSFSYRVKPEPKRVTEKLYWNGEYFCHGRNSDTTQTLAFETINGRIDPASLRVEDVSDE